MDSFPNASVVIPTHNRHASLLETIDSLSDQTLGASRFEVIVVDDGSTDATPEIQAETYPFTLRYVAQKNQGAAAARNHGAKTSRGNILVFIDDDITLDSSYLQVLVQAHQSQQKLVSMGVFHPYLTGHDSVFAVQHARRTAAEAAEQGNREVSFTECSSNNMTIERQDFFEVGMWQDVFGDGPTLWGDVEFGYRAWKQGLKFSRIAGAKLYHRDYHVMELRSACRRAYHISETVHFLFRRHPEIEQHVSTFWDKEPISLKSDSPGLVAHKAFHVATACPPGLWTLEHLAGFLETRAPESNLLGLLYRWTISAYLYKGYRKGLRQLGQSKP